MISIFLNGGLELFVQIQSEYASTMKKCICQDMKACKNFVVILIKLIGCYGGC